MPVECFDWYVCVVECRYYYTSLIQPFLVISNHMAWHGIKWLYEFTNTDKFLHARFQKYQFLREKSPLFLLKDLRSCCMLYSVTKTWQACKPFFQIWSKLYRYISWPAYVSSLSMGYISANHIFREKTTLHALLYPFLISWPAFANIG